jgi:hypothetical protein
VDLRLRCGRWALRLGWQLLIPAITRASRRGLPRYRDHEDSDDFTLFDAEDLVPPQVHDEHGQWVLDRPRSRTVAGADYRVER